MSSAQQYTSAIETDELTQKEPEVQQAVSAMLALTRQVVELEPQIQEENVGNNNNQTQQAISDCSTIDTTTQCRKRNCMLEQLLSDSECSTTQSSETLVTEEAVPLDSYLTAPQAILVHDDNISDIAQNEDTDILTIDVSTTHTDTQPSVASTSKETNIQQQSDNVLPVVIDEPSSTTKTSSKTQSKQQTPKDDTYETFTINCDNAHEALVVKQQLCTTLNAKFAATIEQKVSPAIIHYDLHNHTNLYSFTEQDALELSIMVQPSITDATTLELFIYQKLKEIEIYISTLNCRGTNKSMWRNIENTGYVYVDKEDIKRFFKTMATQQLVDEFVPGLVNHTCANYLELAIARLVPLPLNPSSDEKHDATEVLNAAFDAVRSTEIKAISNQLGILCLNKLTEVKCKQLIVLFNERNMRIKRKIHCRAPYMSLIIKDNNRLFLKLLACKSD